MITQEIINAWNDQADAPNSWGNLSDDERIEFAFSLGAKDIYEDAKEMIDCVYEIVEIWDITDEPYSAQLKEKWLRKAREEYGVVPML